MSDYIMSLRALVGSRPLLQVGASVIVVDGDGRVLLQRRRDNGTWGYAGGSVEPGEDVERAAARELLEETGLTALTLELFGVFSGERMHYVYPNGDEVYNVDVVYLCRRWEGELIPQPEEVDELRWFSPEDIPSPLMPPNIPALEKYAAENRKSK